MRLRNRQLSYYLLCCSLAFLPVMSIPAYAENDTIATTAAPNRNITTAEWNEISNDEAFYYRDSLEYKEQKPAPQYRENAFMKFLAALFKALGSTAGQVIVWSVLGLIVIYVVYKIVKGERSRIFGRRSKPMQSGEEAHSVTEDINDTDWDSLLQGAADDGNLRLAVRYSYMMLLQLLQHKDLIQYRSDKTNYEYYSELTDTPYKQPFRQLTRQYEYTWYGDFPIAQNTYDEYMQLLHHLKKQLGR